MDNKLEKRIKDIISTVFEIPIEEINDNSSPDTIESWDSLEHMNLVVAMEEEFSIQLSDRESLDMMNYSLIRAIVIDKLN